MSWARRAPAVEAVIECSGESHAILYRRGSLVVLDHDVPAEAALLGLGGPESECLAALRAWRDTTLDTVSTPETIRWRMRNHGQVPSWVVSLPRELDAARRLTLVATAERVWRRGKSSTAGSYLERETQRLATPALHKWLVASGERALQPLSIACHVVAPPGEPSAETWMRDGARVIGVWLSPSWWREVGISAGGPLVDGGRGFVVDLVNGRRRLARWANGRLTVGGEVSEAV